MARGKAERAKLADFEREALIYSDSLYKFAFHLTRNPTDAEDLVQETLLKAFKAFDSFTLGTNCRAWLFRILVNTLKNQRVKLSSRMEVTESLMDFTLEDIPRREGGPSHDPERVAVRANMTGMVMEELEHMPKEYRMVLVLADLEEFSYREISEMVGCPMGTVMSRLYRARKYLQKKLLERGVVSEKDMTVRGEDKKKTKTGGADKVASMDEYRQLKKGSME